MFLNGSLENFSVTDILQLLSFSRQTGGLYIEGEVTATLYLADGDAYFADTDRSPSLEDLLIARGLSPEAWAEAVTQAPEGPVDEWLLQQGLVDAGVLADVTYGAISTALFELFRMPRDGTFDFRAGERHLSGSSQRFNVDDLTAEARDRVAEWEAIAETISSPTKLLHVAAELPYDQVQITLDASQWNALLTAARRSSFTLATLAEEIGASEADAARALNPLIGAGLVVVLEEGEQVEAAAPDAAQAEEGQAVAAGAEAESGDGHDPELHAIEVDDFDEAGVAAEVRDLLDSENQEPVTAEAEDDFGGLGDEEPVVEPDFAAPEAESVPADAEGEPPDFIDSDVEEATVAEGELEGYELAVPHTAEIETDFTIPEAEPPHSEAEDESELAGTGLEEPEPASGESWSEPQFETPTEDELAATVNAGEEETSSWETASADRPPPPWGKPEPLESEPAGLQESAGAIDEPLVAAEDESPAEPVPTVGALDESDWEAGDWASPPDYQVISEEGLEDAEDPLAGLELTGDPLDATEFLELGDTDPARWSSPRSDDAGDTPQEQPGPDAPTDSSPVDEWDAATGTDRAAADPRVSPDWDLNRWSVEPVSESEQEVTPSAFEWAAPEEPEAPAPVSDVEAGAEALAVQNDEPLIPLVEESPAEDRVPAEDPAPGEDREPDYGVAGFRTVALQELRDLAGTGAPPPPTPARTSPRRSPNATPPKPSPEAAAPKVRALRRIIAAVRGL